MLCRWFARAERARFRLLLDRGLPGPARAERTNWWRGMWRILPVRGSLARAAAYAFLRLPVELRQRTSCLVTLVWSLGLALVTSPAYVRKLPGGGAHIDGYLIQSHGALIAAVLIPAWSAAARGSSHLP